ncbi:N-acyl-L-homoserine lactone synthetase RhlL [Candidatus Burkholderia humilis]|nr:N-acyl-L-homoserine lactone synthetase RhlL [Candidatus Burkholderia humilis]
MRFLIGKGTELPRDIFVSMGRLRYQTFVKNLNWILLRADDINGVEYDEFDTEHTIYVVELDDDDDVIATARLIQTNRPYLLQRVFPGFAPEDALPYSAEIWESFSPCSQAGDRESL